MGGAAEGLEGASYRGREVAGGGCQGTEIDSAKSTIYLSVSNTQSFHWGQLRTVVVALTSVQHTKVCI